VVIQIGRFARCLAVIVVITAAAWMSTACSPPTDDRVTVESSDPRVACSQVQGPRASNDAQSAIAHAKSTWAAIHEKDPSNEMTAPAYLAKFEPFSATLKDGVWHVQGTIPAAYHGYVPVMSICHNDEGASAGSITVP